MEKNLLRRESGRLLMLETVRAYARELLENDDRGSEVLLRHCRHFVALAETGTPHLRTHTEAEWMARLDAETDNFRAALDWALREGPQHWPCGWPAGSAGTGSSGGPGRKASVG